MVGVDELRGLGNPHPRAADDGFEVRSEHEVFYDDLQSLPIVERCCWWSVTANCWTCAQ
jgi:hypothetical protein